LYVKTRETIINLSSTLSSSAHIVIMFQSIWRKANFPASPGIEWEHETCFLWFNFSGNYLGGTFAV